MIIRIWHGYTTPANAAMYEQVLLERVIPGIESMGIAGYCGIEVLRRNGAGSIDAPEVEFITIMRFDALDAVRQFVGDDIERVHVPAVAREVLARFDLRATHYELISTRDANHNGTVQSVVQSPILSANHPINFDQSRLRAKGHL